MPCALSAQITQVPFDQCVYRLGDNPAWASVNIDPSGWKPYTGYRETGDAYVVWVRCTAAFDTSGIQHPALVVGSDDPEQRQVFVDGQQASQSGTFRPYSIPREPAGSALIVAVRVDQKLLAPGDSPGRPVRLFLGDAPYLSALIGAERGEGFISFVPTYSSYLVIGAAGLFLLGLFLFDRSQKAAFWLGVYCCCVCMTRLNVMIFFLFSGNFPFSLLVDSVFFGVSMFESWALVRVNFALAQRRVPAVYWVVFAAWVFMFLGCVLPAVLPAPWALPLSLFVQVTCFKPIWCIWTFACTAPFVAFWPWMRLSRRMRIVAALCAVWAVIGGWFQLQQVIYDRQTWSGAVQNWMSLAIAALVIALFGYIFHQQRITAADRCDDLRPAAVLRELNAALRNSGIEGFTTCLCADLSASGVLLISNAGQLPPYRNGQEIEIPAGLPLGVEAAADYAESSLQLAPGDKLTFLSNGVVEARNAVGELFGCQLSSRAAQQIADAAVQFGQQDDITVLTLSLAPVHAAA